MKRAYLRWVILSGLVVAPAIAASAVAIVLNSEGPLYRSEALVKPWPVPGLMNFVSAAEAQRLLGSDSSVKAALGAIGSIQAQNETPIPVPAVGVSAVPGGQLLSVSVVWDTPSGASLLLGNLLDQAMSKENLALALEQSQTAVEDDLQTLTGLYILISNIFSEEYLEGADHNIQVRLTVLRPVLDAFIAKYISYLPTEMRLQQIQQAYRSGFVVQRPSIPHAPIETPIFSVSLMSAAAGLFLWIVACIVFCGIGRGYLDRESSLDELICD